MGIDPELLTINQAAAFLAISRSGLYALMQTFQIPHVRLGKRIRFRRETLKAWCKQLEVGGPGEALKARNSKKKTG
jgi:excisionase family DNA binding protein